VSITKTVNFDVPSIYPPVTNATVIISDNTGKADTLSHTTDGNYVTSTLQGVIGRTYTLNVTVDGKKYTSKSTMPDSVGIDSLYFKKSPFGRGTLVTLDIMNQPGKENYYRVIHFENDVQATGFSVFSENTNDVEKISYSFMPTTDNTRNAPQKLEKGDVITVWLECIDKGVFEYFRTANREGGQNASPANPVSNISDGALGYFNACTVRKAKIVYQQ